jgi:hypothetical protein
MINEKKVTAGQTFNVLTWQHILVKEEFVMLRDSLTQYFQQHQRLLLEQTTTSKSCLFCYDCHDGKMIYQLLQHTQWNRKHHPFKLVTA